MSTKTGGTLEPADAARELLMSREAAVQAANDASTLSIMPPPELRVTSPEVRLSTQGGELRLSGELRPSGELRLAARPEMRLANPEGRHAADVMLDDEEEPAPVPDELEGVQQGQLFDEGDARMKNRALAAEQSLSVPALAEWASALTDEADADAHDRIFAGLPVSFASTQFITKPDPASGRLPRSVQRKSDLPEVTVLKSDDRSMLTQMQQVLKRPANRIQLRPVPGHIDWRQIENAGEKPRPRRDRRTLEGGEYQAGDSQEEEEGGERRLALPRDRGSGYDRDLVRPRNHDLVRPRNH
ncbi:hypothetical protein T484DRAFT_1902081, partial [Baffinella frigidus]